jgi:hypothetical protein
MIDNPQNVFEQVQNEVAAKLAALAIFTGIKMPDGADFEILTEDEGDPEMMFTAQIARAGLSVIVQSPSGKFDNQDEVTIRANPFVVAVSISEAILFNRSGGGTGLRLMRVTWAVLQALNGFAPASLGERLFATRLLKDKDTKPDSEELVASRIITFEAVDVIIPLSA